MARDRTRNAYFTVGIPLDSETYQAIKADAMEAGISIPQLLAVRIADWYKCSAGIGLAASAAAIRTPVAAEQTQRASAPSLHELQSRASAAAAAWGGEDDE
jgi:hypothetical protein